MKQISWALPLLLIACAASEPETSMASDPLLAASAPISSSGQDEAQLAGDWHISAIDGAAIPADLVGQLAQALTVSFDVAEGRVSGYSGCNRFSGSYRGADRPFALDGLASSKMYCEASADLESRILQALRRVSQFQVDGDSLRLQTASAETALELAR